MAKEQEMTDVPMIIYSCKLKKSNRCLFVGVKPSGARDSYGDLYCKVPASPVKSVATACDSVNVEETQIIAKVTKSGMIT